MTRREILVFVPVYSSPTILFIPLFGVGGVLKTTFNVSGQFVNFLVLLVQLNSKFKYFTVPAHFFAAIVCNDSIATKLLLDDEEKQKLKQPFYAYIKPYR